jgi:hypothetical protein
MIPWAPEKQIRGARQHKAWVERSGTPGLKSISIGYVVEFARLAIKQLAIART